MSSTTATCHTCSARVTAGSRFCGACGADVRAEQEQVSTLEVIESRPSRSLPKREELRGQLQAALAGEYEILGELGRGGMATVYLARETALDRKVAIKVMSPLLLYGDGMAERFKREARTAGGLSHPHIIPIHAVRETGDLLFFVMKYVEGRPLDSVLKELGQVPIRMGQVILTQVGSALHHAHRRQVVHRDVKPANIMIDEDGWAVVTDFGIAKVQNAADLTRPGAAVGTPHYMSPEQCSGEPVTAASDQYSLGIVAYEMLTGRPPFTGASVLEIMRSHFSDAPPTIEIPRPDCPPGLAQVVLRMLAKDPADRFPSMDDAVQAIGAAPLTKDDPVRTQMVELARTGQRERPRYSAKLAPGRPSRVVAPSPRESVARPRASAQSQPGQEAGPAVPGSHRAHPDPERRNPTAGRSQPTLPLRWGRRSASGAGWMLPVGLAVAAVASGWVAMSTLTRPSKTGRDSSTVAPVEAKPAAPKGLAVGPPQPRSLGYVRLNTRYPGTKLILDGKTVATIGTSPVIVRVPAGKAQLRVERAGCRPKEVPLQIRSGDTLKIGRVDPVCP